jgi:hypothetical protein
MLTLIEVLFNRTAELLICNLADQQRLIFEIHCAAARALGKPVVDVTKISFVKQEMTWGMPSIFVKVTYLPEDMKDEVACDELQLLKGLANDLKTFDWLPKNVVDFIIVGLSTHKVIYGLINRKNV